MRYWAIPPVRSLASEVFIPISKQLHDIGIPASLPVGTPVTNTSFQNQGMIYLEK